jgi:DNA-directed RNA polymerase specialized sigma24 family protein
MWTFHRPPTAKGRQAPPRLGDLPAVNRLVQAHQARLYTIAYRALGSPAQAEAATQSAVEACFQQRASLRSPDAEAALLRCLVAEVRRASRGALNTSDSRLGQLPFDLRLPLVLIDVAGLDYELAASALHVSLVELVHLLAQGRRWLCPATAR